MTDAHEHPIIGVAARALQESRGSLILGREGREALTAALKNYFGKPGLREAVRALLIFAVFLEHKKSSPEAAAAVIDVLRAAEKPMAAQQLHLDGLASSLTNEEKVRRLLGQESPSTQPPGTETQASVMKWWESLSKRSP
jgi:hypothetical protein